MLCLNNNNNYNMNNNNKNDTAALTTNTDVAGATIKTTNPWGLQDVKKNNYCSMWRHCCCSCLLFRKCKVIDSGGGGGIDNNLINVTSSPAVITVKVDETENENEFLQ